MRILTRKKIREVLEHLKFLFDEATKDMNLSEFEKETKKTIHIVYVIGGLNGLKYYKHLIEEKIKVLEKELSEVTDNEC